MAKDIKRRASKVKSSTKKSSAKRTTRRRKKQSTFKKDLIIFFSVVALVTIVAFGYHVWKDQPKPDSKVRDTYSTAVQNEDKALLKNLEKIRDERKVKEKLLRGEERKAQEEKAQKKEQAKIELLKQLQEAKQKEQEEPKILIDDSSQYPDERVKYEEIISLPESIKPKLVIIIDDVSSRSQLKHIGSLDMKITPAIFPPFKGAPRNHLLAEGLKHYMIHLPMESGKAYDKQAKTLMTRDSKETIEARVKEIRTLFPTAKYVNNHTGSVFTNDENAMEILYSTLQEEGFVFIDSRTTATTKVPKIAKKYAQRYLARDVFLDNHQNMDYIHKQLGFAVEEAKKRGYAIAIGHPHKTTFQALTNAKHILKDVELVYIDELYGLKDEK